MSSTPRKLRSQGPAETVEMDNTTDRPAAPTDHLNVEQELGFYAAYHSNKVNQAIHFACIPMILWTALIMLAQIKLSGQSVHVLSPGLAFQPNGALLIISSYTAYYYLLEPFAAATFTPVAILMYLTATYLANFTPLSLPLRLSGLFGLSKPSSMPFTIALHLSSWIAQFIGHGVFEGRAPALMTSLVQALVLAPFFVHLEMLFTFFNCRKALASFAAGAEIQQNHRQDGRGADRVDRPELHKAMINAASKRIVAMNRAAKRAT